MKNYNNNIPLMLIPFFIVMLINSMCYASETSNEVISDRNAYTLLSQLLGLPSKSNDSNAPLDQYKKWSKVMTKYSDIENMSRDQIKILLFTVFIAKERVMIESQEFATEKIVPAYLKNPEIFLGILNELPFLITSTCDVFPEYFDSLKQRQEFVDKYFSVMKSILGGKKANQCIQHILVK